jgi:hypothetical protein
MYLQLFGILSIYSLFFVIAFLAIFGVPIFGFYFLLPLKFKRTRVKPVTNEHRLIDASEIPSTLTDYFAVSSAALKDLGFQEIGLVTNPDNDLKSYASHWINPATNDLATLAAIFNDQKPIDAKLVGFHTEFEDQTSIITSNASHKSIWPSDPRLDSIRCPQVLNFKFLYRFHRARVEQDRGSRRVKTDHSPNLMDRLTDIKNRLYKHLIDYGYYTLDPSNQTYVPTYKGVYLTTWRLLPPLRQILIYLANRRADLALRKTGFGGLHQFEADAAADSKSE